MPTPAQSKQAREAITAYNAGLSPEQRREQAIRAGQASGAARQAHRLFKDILKDILSAPITDEDEAFAALKALGFERPRHEDAIMLAASKKAATGDIEAVRFLRDTLGEKPTEAFNMNLTGKPVKSLDLSKLSDEELEALADKSD